MPGVLLCEAVMQAGCYLMVHRYSDRTDTPKGVPVVARMSDVKFKQMVEPGDVLDVVAEFERSAMGVYFMKGSVKKGGKVAASLSFVVTTAPQKEGE